MAIFFSKEVWKTTVGDVGREVVRDKGKFVRTKIIKDIDFEVSKTPIVKTARKIQLTKKYIIYESNELLAKRGQVLSISYIRKGKLSEKVLGASYLSPNVKRDYKKLLEQSIDTALKKSELIETIGYDVIEEPDETDILTIYFKYIIKKEEYITKKEI